MEACRALETLDSPDVAVVLDAFADTTTDPDLRERAKRVRAAQLERSERRQQNSVGSYSTTYRSVYYVPRTPPQKPLIVTARVGTKRMPGRFIDSYLSYEPTGGQALSNLKAVQRDKLEFAVHEFEQSPAIATSGFQVESRWGDHRRRYR